MKTKLNIKLTALWLLIAASCFQACAQGTAFSYDGQLQSMGRPVADGLYDFQFNLSNAPTGGSQVGSTVPKTAVPVTNGLFTTTLDFGAVFTGNATWLAISVCSNGVGNFQSLAPLQELTPTPYAIFAESSSNVSGTVSAAQLTGTLGNAQLANSSITINPGTGLSGGGIVALGGAITLNATGSGGGVVTVNGNSDITANTAGGVVTLGDTATSANTPSTIVKRDSSGNFSASSVTLVGGNLYLPSPAVIYAGGNPTLIDEGSFFAGGAGNTTLTGSSDVGIGLNALHSVTTGVNNAAVGEQALKSDTRGSNNVANGYTALYSNTSGYGNTAEGMAALYKNTTGYYNTANGLNTLYSNTTGFYNTANGYQALAANTTGGENTANGAGALGANTTGTANMASGANALAANTTGSDNTASGDNALIFNTIGTENVANGWGAMFVNTTGSHNTAVGAYALPQNQTGNYNTAVGEEALYQTLASDNTAIGYQALHNNNAGGNNTASGYGALYANTTGNNNTADGYGALGDNWTGKNNTASGFQALGQLGNIDSVGGTNNIAVGYQAGNNYTQNESSNIDIGYPGVLGENNTIHIGDPNVQTATYLAGTVYANGVMLTSDRNAKENFSTVNALAVLAKVASLPVTEWNYKSDNKEVQHIGPMAQDFQAAFQLDGADDKHISVVDEGGVALAAIQGLNEKLEETEQAVKTKNSEIQELRQRLEALEKIVIKQKTN